ncbi:hypothetical protein ABWH91_08350 [Phycisphaerales bacterium ac7]
MTTALFGVGLGDEAEGGGRASWQVAADIFGVMLLLAGLGVGVFGLVRCVAKKKPLYAYGSAGRWCWRRSCSRYSSSASGATRNC